MSEPKTLRAGETWEWAKTISDYPATTWTLKYIIINSSAKITITATADGTDYSVSVSADSTKNYAAGTYQWISQVEKGTAPNIEKHGIETGILKILPNLATETTYDTRSHVKKTLDAIEAVIQGRATLDQQSYTIAGRSITKIPVAELLTLRDRYKWEYAQELKAEAIARGEDIGGQILVRFK